MPSTRIQFRVPKAAHADLEEWAQSEGCSVNELARDLVIERMGHHVPARIPHVKALRFLGMTLRKRRG